MQIPYAVFTFADGNKKVISRLEDIAKQTKIPEECQKVAASHGVFSGHHHTH